MITRRVGALGIVVALVAGAGCSSSHSGTDDDAGSTPGLDGGAPGDRDGAIPGDDDGSVDPDRDGGGARPDGGGVITLPDGGTIPVARVGTPCTTDAECPGLFCSTAGSGFGYCSWICGEGNPCPGDAACVRFDDAATYGYCMQPCSPGGDDCATGYLCQPGLADQAVCYPGCTTSADCRAGTMCGSGVSGVRQCYTPGAVVGGGCQLTEHCPEEGYCLDEDGWGVPGGICVTFCDLGSGAGCAEGFTCVAWGFDSGAGTCIPTCDDARPCRDGYQCVDTGEGDTRACVARCTSDDECTAGNSCNFVTGRCG